MHGITAVSHGLVQQTGQFVDDAAEVVATHLLQSLTVFYWSTPKDLVRRLRPPIRKMKCRITIGLLIPVRVIWLLGDIGICYQGFGSSGNGNRAYGLSGILFSGFWLIGDIAIGLLVYRGICYRGFGLSGIWLSGFWLIGVLLSG